MNSKLIGIILCILALLVVILVFGKDFLIVNEEPKSTDVIIVLSGDQGRLEKGAALYLAGYGDYVLLTRANAKFITVEEAVAYGIPESRLILEEEATSTYTNAVYARSLLVEHQFDSAIVVSSDYHMRRTELAFDRVFEESDIELTYVAAADNGEVGEFSIRATISEYVKLIGYTLGLYKFINLKD